MSGTIFDSDSEKRIRQREDNGFIEDLVLCKGPKILAISPAQAYSREIFRQLSREGSVVKATYSNLHLTYRDGKEIYFMSPRQAISGVGRGLRFDTIVRHPAIWHLSTENELDFLLPGGLLDSCLS